MHTHFLRLFFSPHPFRPTHTYIYKQTHGRWQPPFFLACTLNKQKSKWHPLFSLHSHGIWQPLFFLACTCQLLEFTWLIHMVSSSNIHMVLYFIIAKKYQQTPPWLNKRKSPLQHRQPLSEPTIIILKTENYHTPP